jgi:exodeoxyribonuclease-3
MQPQSRAANRRLLARGRTNSICDLRPREVIHTYWVDSNSFGRNAGFRMDFLLLGPALAFRLKEANVDSEFRGREGASDQVPTWASLSGRKCMARGS